ncbi:hypothetical protein Tb11.02.1240 [Trypanosoma brucei brucei TREU927]|uniref:Uncharacterized protein n=2 Tax=Trypanosoma brucei TaxID=5691 RepID=Q386D6_TRYB2|nr:hypothetical protein Tb11.02.1240 [Trypanosoma brucei brucei TREU927]EAN79345.1 hypothetical protein Tb11.02.1240 [Trypanosoma brucei brucei TREU927]RHW67581.1 hypothetical protein DPX39_110045400 [Trypanosoma brucei equiperdum]
METKESCREQDPDVVCGQEEAQTPEATCGEEATETQEAPEATEMKGEEQQDDNPSCENEEAQNAGAPPDEEEGDVTEPPDAAAGSHTSQEAGVNSVTAEGGSACTSPKGVSVTAPSPTEDNFPDRQPQIRRRLSCAGLRIGEHSRQVDEEYGYPPSHYHTLTVNCGGANGDGDNINCGQPFAPMARGVGLVDLPSMYAKKDNANGDAVLPAASLFAHGSPGEEWESTFTVKMGLHANDDD